VAQAKEELRRFEADAAARRAELSARQAEVQAQVKDIESQIPADLRGQYNRIIGAKGHDGLAAVRGRTCSACYTEITVQNYTDLTQGHYVLCKSCGRILYLPEEAGQRAQDED
jgi:predicted  nucleic acid-binding Zn-ribbon protein